MLFQRGFYRPDQDSPSFQDERLDTLVSFPELQGFFQEPDNHFYHRERSLEYHSEW